MIRNKRRGNCGFVGTCYVKQRIILLHVIKQFNIQTIQSIMHIVRNESVRVGSGIVLRDPV